MYVFLYVCMYVVYVCVMYDVCMNVYMYDMCMYAMYVCVVYDMCIYVRMYAKIDDR